MAPNKGTLLYSAWNVLNNSLKVKEDERVVIVTDQETFDEVGTPLLNGADLLTQYVQAFVMEKLGSRPLTSLPSQLETALKEADVTIYAAGTREGELGFRMPMIRTALGSKARHGHAPGINREIMLSGMQADIPECNARCADLYERLNGIDWARVTSSAGTDITFEFDPRIKWVNSDWDFSERGKWGNLPSGEVFTWPFRSNGVYVVDGVLGDHFDQKYGALVKTPVTYQIKDNRIVGIHCDNKDLLRELGDYVFENHNCDLIGELGIGALESGALVSRMLQDEKKAGTVHIAHGNSYPRETGSPDYGQKNHCDGIILNASLVTSRGDTILDKGQYVPRSI